MSTSLFTGAVENVFYALDEEGTTLHAHWDLPRIGDNEASMNVVGPHRDFYSTLPNITGGNKRVHTCFIIGEKAALAVCDSNKTRSDWQTCGKCKLFCFLDSMKVNVQEPHFTQVL